jgi:DNA repair protein RecO (recombination protein O)
VKPERTYRVTGISLKAYSLGERDRLITVLTKEEGLIQVVAKGSRKGASQWGGRMDLFVVNDLLITCPNSPKGLHRIIQAETLQTFPRFSRSLIHVTAAQYLAEVILLEAVTGIPQEDLFLVFLEHLERIQKMTSPIEVLIRLSHALYHVLALGGVAPQVHFCHLCQDPVESPLGDTYFSLPSGGILCQSCASAWSSAKLSFISAEVLPLLQLLSAPTLPPLPPEKTWLRVETFLRRWIEYHTERQLRSPQVLESCFSSDNVILSL